MGRAYVTIDTHLLIEMCKPNDEPRWCRVVENAIPADARVVAIRIGHPDWLAGETVDVLIESDSLPHVEGELPQLDPPTLQEVYLSDAKEDA